MEEEKSPMTGMTQEEKDEYVMGKAMDIIMGSGDARLHASKAMDHIAKGELDEAKAELKEADKLQAEAHNVQTEMIQGDIRGGDEKMGYYVLFVQCSTEVEQVNFRQQVPLLQTW